MRGFNEPRRDHSLDFIIVIVVAVLLMAGAFGCFPNSGRCETCQEYGLINIHDFREHRVCSRCKAQIELTGQVSIPPRTIVRKEVVEKKR